MEHGARSWASATPDTGRWSLESKVAVGFGSAFLLLVLIGLAQHRSMRLVVESNVRVSRAEVVMTELDAVLSASLEAERGCAFYIFTGYLQSYQAAVPRVREHLRRLEILTDGDPDRRSRLNVLQPLVASHLDRLQYLVELRQRSAVPDVRAAVENGEGMKIVEDIRDTVREMESAERELVRQENGHEDAAVRQTAWLSTLAILLGIGVLVLAGLAIRLDIAGRKRSEEERDRFWALSNDLIVVAGLDGYVKRLSAAWETTLGFTLEELTATPYMSFIHPDDRERTVARPENLPPSDGITTAEVRILCKDGSFKWLQWRAALPAGTDTIYAVAQDITVRKRSEAEMHQLLASIVQFSDDAIIGKDLAGTVLSWNQGAEKVYGYSGEEVQGKSVSILIPPDRADELPRTMERIRRGEAVDHFETVRVRKDGTRIDVSLTISPIRDASGKVVAASTIAKDITERKQAEAENVRLATAIEQAAEGVLITDVDGAIQYVNPAFTRLTGYTRAEAVGQNPRFLKSGGHDFQFYQELWQTISAGHIWHGEMVNRRKDGTLYTEDTTIAPVRDSAGAITNFIAIKQDVTERKRAEDALRRQAALDELITKILARFATCPGSEVDASVTAALQATADFIGVDHAFVTVLSADGTAWSAMHEWCGPGITPQHQYYQSRLLGTLPWTEGRVLADEIVRVNTPDDFPPEALAERRNQAAEGALSELNVPIKTVRGVVSGSLGLHSHARAVTWSDSDVAHLRMVGDAIASVIERKRAEEEIRQLNQDLERRVLARTAELEDINRELEAFTYSVSHDLRAPLRHIAGFAKILCEEAGAQLGPSARDCLNRIEESTQYMGRLINELLNLSRVSRQDLSVRSTALNSVVEDVVRELQPECSGREIEWRIGRLPVLDCDPGLIRVVFANLLANAVKFTRRRLRAVIEVDRKALEGQSVVFVRDNGVGFDMKYVDRLFRAFQRLHRAEEFEGTGVGLATVQRIVRRHGGRVWAEAELGKGATFYFTLSAPAKAAGGNAALPEATDSFEVLLVEDSAADEALALHELGKHKPELRVHVAHDGEQALDFLFSRGAYSEASGKTRPALVLLDLELPELSGKEVLQAIRTDARTKSLPVVILTGSRLEELPSSLRSDSGCYHIHKPLSVENLQQAISELGIPRSFSDNLSATSETPTGSLIAEG